jgi:hypothetical protein
MTAALDYLRQIKESRHPPSVEAAKSVPTSTDPQAQAETAVLSRRRSSDPGPASDAVKTSAVHPDSKGDRTIKHGRKWVISRSMLKRVLPPTYSPTPNTVVLGLPHPIGGHAGNKILRNLAARHLKKFFQSTNDEQTAIAYNLMNQINASNAVAGFVYMHSDARWWEVTEYEAYRKVIEMFAYVRKDFLRRVEEQKGRARGPGRPSVGVEKRSATAQKMVVDLVNSDQERSNTVVEQPPEQQVVQNQVDTQKLERKRRMEDDFRKWKLQRRSEKMKVLSNRQNELQEKTAINNNQQVNEHQSEPIQEHCEGKSRIQTTPKNVPVAAIKEKDFETDDYENHNASNKPVTTDASTKSSQGQHTFEKDEPVDTSTKSEPREGRIYKCGLCGRRKTPGGHDCPYQKDSKDSDGSEIDDEENDDDSADMVSSTHTPVDMVSTVDNSPEVAAAEGELSDDGKLGSKSSSGKKDKKSKMKDRKSKKSKKKRRKDMEGWTAYTGGIQVFKLDESFYHATLPVMDDITEFAPANTGSLAPEDNDEVDDDDDLVI